MNKAFSYSSLLMRIWAFLSSSAFSLSSESSSSSLLLLLLFGSLFILWLILSSSSADFSYSDSSSSWSCFVLLALPEIAFLFLFPILITPFFFPFAVGVTAVDFCSYYPFLGSWPLLNSNGKLDFLLSGFPLFGFSCSSSLSPIGAALLNNIPKSPSPPSYFLDIVVNFLVTNFPENCFDEVW